MSASGNPYVGRRAFDVGDWEIFFGRNRECYEVSRLWQRESVVVLHGPAGCGKTSLLRAGITRTLSEQAGGPLLGHTSFGSPFPQAALSDHNRYTVAVLSSWYPGEPLTKLATLSLTDFLCDRATDSNTADNPLPIFAAIDQFEEMFRGPQATLERDAFFADLATAVRIVPQLKILLVIRSEDLDELTPYKQQLNLKDRAYYRITALDREAALYAVRGPMEKTGQRFTGGVAELVVRELLAAPVTDIIEAGNRKLATTVEPVQLQEVCSHLGQILCTDGCSPSLDSVQIAEYVEKSLSAFCVKVVSEVAAKLGVTTSAVGAWVKRTFIAIDGSPLRISERSINSVSLQLVAVRALLDQHLLIAEFESGARWYMLANDRLILAVQQLKPPAPGDKIPIFDALDHLRAATSALAAGDLDLAARHAGDALVSQDQDARLQADAHSLLGNVAYHRGHMDEAEKQYMRAAQLCEELQDQSAVGTLLAAMGRIHAIRGRRAAALEELQSAVTRLPGDLALQTEFAKALSKVGRIQAELQFLERFSPMSRTRSKHLSGVDRFRLTLGTPRPPWTIYRPFDGCAPARAYTRRSGRHMRWHSRGSALRRQQ